MRTTGYCIPINLSPPEVAGNLREASIISGHSEKGCRFLRCARQTHRDVACGGRLLWRGERSNKVGARSATVAPVTSADLGPCSQCCLILLYTNRTLSVLPWMTEHNSSIILVPMNFVAKILELVPGFIFAAMMVVNAVIMIKSGLKVNRLMRKLEDAYRSDGRRWEYADYTLSRIAKTIDPKSISDGNDSIEILEIKKEIVEYNAFTKYKILLKCWSIMIFCFGLMVLAEIVYQIFNGWIHGWPDI